MANDPLDEYFDSTSRRVHSSPRKLANVVRAAYPIGVPALIMKSSTDRFGEAAGYSCLLYTSPSPRDAHESRMPSSA